MRLRDVPSTIGWDGLALFLRHLPHDSALARELEPAARWSDEMHALATIVDQINFLMYGLSGGAGAKPAPTPRPGASARFEGAEIADVNERLANLAWKEERHGR